MNPLYNHPQDVVASAIAMAFAVTFAMAFAMAFAVAFAVAFRLVALQCRCLAVPLPCLLQVFTREEYQMETHKTWALGTLRLFCYISVFISDVIQHPKLLPETLNMLDAPQNRCR